VFVKNYFITAFMGDAVIEIAPIAAKITFCNG